MIYVDQLDKRVCAPNRCTATSFFGLSVALNKKAEEHFISKSRGITSKTKTVSVTRRAALALRGLLRVFGRFAKPQQAPELQS
jgi:hypothetical protein